MKTIKLLLLVITTTLSAQESAIEIGFGPQHFTGQEHTPDKSVGVDFTGSYMFNSMFGVFGRASNDILNSINPNYSYTESTIMAGVSTNTGLILGLNKNLSVVNRFGSGVGFLTSPKSTNQNLLVVGLTTSIQYKVSKSFFFKLEHTRIGNIGQDYRLDTNRHVCTKGVDSYLDTFRVGFGFMFGKESKKFISPRFF